MARNTATAPKAEPDSDEADAAFAPSWFVPAPQPNHTLPTPLGPSTDRLWFTLMGARVCVAAGLLALQVLAWWQGTSSPWLLALCAGYLVATAAVLRWSRPALAQSGWSAGWALTLWLDLAVFGLLQTLQQGQVNYTPLFILPVLLASMLGPLVLALGSAAVATLIMLLDAFTSDVLRVGQTRYIQAAITSVGLFLVAFLAHQLASRLGREQARTRVSQAQAAAQAQVNQLIVTGLSEGVLVLDAQGRVWHANPAACAMLGAPTTQPPYTPLTALPGWPALAEWARNTLLLGHDDRCEIGIPTPAGKPLHLLLRARVTKTADGPAPASVCVLFMEMQREVQSRARNEKLAAMGRVSAALAHEIRNPLAAIAQANALLAEETLSPIQQRLTGMIGQNAKRLGRTVDDILDVAKLPASPALHDCSTVLDDTVAATLADWQAQHPGAPAPQWHPGAAGLQVRFDAEHLRRVLVNLLDNAQIHGSGGSGAIEVSSAAGQLSVWNPGPPMPAQVAAHLFEPFASSHSRSSGLGLYLSRQLCERHGAQLSYQPGSRHGVAGHGFVVKFGA